MYLSPNSNQSVSNPQNKYAGHSQKVLQSLCSGDPSYFYANNKSYDSLAVSQMNNGHFSADPFYGNTPVLASSSESTPLHDPVTPNHNHHSSMLQQKDDFVITANMFSHTTFTGLLFDELGANDITNNMNLYACQSQPSPIDDFYNNFVELDKDYFQTAVAKSEDPHHENLFFGGCNGKATHEGGEFLIPGTTIPYSNYGNGYDEADYTRQQVLNAQTAYTCTQSQNMNSHLLTHPPMNQVSTMSPLNHPIGDTNLPLKVYPDSSNPETQRILVYQNLAANQSSKYTHHYDNMPMHPNMLSYVNNSLYPTATLLDYKNIMGKPLLMIGNNNSQEQIENTHTKVENLISEDNQKESKRVKCPQCPKLITKKNLSAHKTTVHDKTKDRHSCPFPNCNKSYSRKNDLEDRHIKPFHRGLNYQCKNCPSSFTRKDKLTRHVQRVHKNSN